MKEGTCPLFKFCNCKTAMCLAALPDESCYWYRYFDKLIKQRQSEKEVEIAKNYFNNLQEGVR